MDAVNGVKKSRKSGKISMRTKDVKNLISRLDKLTEMLQIQTLLLSQLVESLQMSEEAENQNGAEAESEFHEPDAL